MSESICKSDDEIKFRYLDPQELPKEESGFLLNAKGEVIGYKRVEIMTVQEYQRRYVNK